MIVEGLYLGVGRWDWIGYGGPTRFYFIEHDHKTSLTDFFCHIVFTDEDDGELDFIAGVPKLILPIEFIKGM